MTNTKFRKRALLSSVAMLLVALVALGSATFAWFVDEPDADAKGISVQANTGLGLVLKTTTDSTNWVHHAQLYKGITGDSILTPVTTGNNGTSFWTGSAAASSASGIKTGDTTSKWSEITPTLGTLVSGGVYKEVVTLKTTGGKAADIKLNKVVINSKDAAMSGAVTVLVVPTGGTAAEFNVGGTAIKKWKAATLTASTATAANDNSTITATASGTAVNTTIFSNVSAGTEKTVTVYVYLDGANDSVYTDQASTAQLVDGIELYFHADEHV